VGGPKIRFFMGAWFSCDDHKDRQEILSFKPVVLDKRLKLKEKIKKFDHCRCMLFVWLILLFSITL